MLANTDFVLFTVDDPGPGDSRVAAGMGIIVLPVKILSLFTADDLSQCHL